MPSNTLGTSLSIIFLLAFLSTKDNPKALKEVLKVAARELEGCAIELKKRRAKKQK